MGAAVCAAVLELALEPMRTAARGYGYTLAVHGSLARDIDLVAVPWTDGAAEKEELAETLMGVLRAIFGKGHMSEWAEKPQGRQAFLLHAFAEGHGYTPTFDLSVMPRAAKKDEK
jgi:hypothetical protein